MNDAGRKAALDARQAQQVLEQERRERATTCLHAIQAILELNQCQMHVDEVYRDGVLQQRRLTVEAKPLNPSEVGNPAPVAMAPVAAPSVGPADEVAGGNGPKESAGPEMKG